MVKPHDKVVTTEEEIDSSPLEVCSTNNMSIDPEQEENLIDHNESSYVKRGRSKTRRKGKKVREKTNPHSQETKANRFCGI